VQALRQPGSSFKPIIYTAAIDTRFTPASVLMDSPLVFQEAQQELAWRPRNYDEQFFGPTTIREAVTRSRNIITIKVLKEVGIDEAIQYARLLGINSPLARDLSIALGSSAVTLKELTVAYSTLANLGTKPEPLEIVRAYLAKYPSSITMTDAELKSAAHTESWLRNEMERRVWLMEKWVGVGNADVLKQAEAERAILEHAEVFSKYMHKYLGDSPNEMIKGFFLASRPFNWTRLTAEVGKLRAWWDANKSRPLLISGLSPGFRLAEGWPILLGGLGAARQLWVERGRVSGYLGRWLSKSR
jgi:membrane carboxypeptidase/penicillin-binding protein